MIHHGKAMVIVRQIMPSAAHLIALHGIDYQSIVGTGPKRNNILKGDVLKFLSETKKATPLEPLTTTTKLPLKPKPKPMEMEMQRIELSKLSISLPSNNSLSPQKIMFACFGTFSRLLKNTPYSDRNVSVSFVSLEDGGKILRFKDKIANVSKILLSDYVKDENNNFKDDPNDESNVLASFTVMSFDDQINQMKLAYLEESTVFNVTALVSTNEATISVCFDSDLFPIISVAESLQRIRKSLQ